MDLQQVNNLSFYLATNVLLKHLSYTELPTSLMVSLTVDQANF